MPVDCRLLPFRKKENVQFSAYYSLAASHCFWLLVLSLQSFYFASIGNRQSTMLTFKQHKGITNNHCKPIWINKQRLGNIIETVDVEWVMQPK